MSNIQRKIDRDQEEATLPTIVETVDAFLEELNVVRLEGRYFCFDKFEAKKRKGTFRYQDGEREVIIQVSAEYGHPSILAYRVLQALFRKVTLEGRPYPDIVAFGLRELGRMIGR